MRIIFTLLALALLSACAPTQMKHPTKSGEHSDFYQCRLVAEERARTWGGNTPNPFLYNDFHIECLEQRGWTRVK